MLDVMKWLQRAIWLGGQKTPKINQTAIADLAGVEKSHVTHWKAGRIRPYLDQVMAIAKGLGVSMDYLLQEEQDWLQDAEKMGVGPAMDRDQEALLRLIAALGISPAEAMRRVAAGAVDDAPPRIVATRRKKSANPDGLPAGADLVDGPAGPRGGIKGRR
jgi:transcriptional regulator with XRE-family HTH domain